MTKNLKIFLIVLAVVLVAFLTMFSILRNRVRKTRMRLNGIMASTNFENLLKNLNNPNILVEINNIEVLVDLDVQNFSAGGYTVNNFDLSLYHNNKLLTQIATPLDKLIIKKGVTNLVIPIRLKTVDLLDFLQGNFSKILLLFARQRAGIDLQVKGFVRLAYLPTSFAIDDTITI